MSRIIMQLFPERRPFIILKDRGKGVFNFSEMGLIVFRGPDRVGMRIRKLM